MRPKRFALPAALIGLTAAIPGSARGQDVIVLRVPVEVQRIHPSVEEGQVVCELENDRGDRRGAGVGTFSLDSNGAHAGVVTVEVRPSISWRDRLDGFTYTCELRLDHQRVGKLADIRQEEYAYSPSAPFTGVVEGDISLR